MLRDLGLIISLMAQSKIHRGWYIADIQRLIVPCLRLGQCYVRHDCFATWVWLTKEAEQGYVSSTRKLQPWDMAAGDRLWVVDFVAPYGNVPRHVRGVKEAILEKHPEAALANVRRLDKQGNVRRFGWYT